MCDLSFDSAVPVEDLQATVPARTEGDGCKAASETSPILTWLEEALRAQRQVLTVLVEQSHRELLGDYVAWEFRTSGIDHRVAVDGAGQKTSMSTNSAWADDGVNQETDCQQVNAVNSVNVEQVSSSCEAQKKVIQSETRGNGFATHYAHCGTSRSSTQSATPTVSLSVPGRSSTTSMLSSSMHSVRSSISNRVLERHYTQHSLFEADRVQRLTSTGFTTQVAQSVSFEVCFGLFIVFNATVMALECQYHGFGLGYNLQYPNYAASSEETWPGMNRVFIVFDTFFGVVFSMEVIIKLAGLRRHFFKDGWNLFDLLIVVGWIIDALNQEVVNLPVDPAILKIARLARLLRLLRLLKTLWRMDSLFMMITTLQSSLHMLFWATVMLSVLLTLMGFLVNQLVVSFYLETGLGDLHGRQKLFEYFGSFTRSMLTMFELTLGNYAPVARVLQENTSEWFMLFTLFHKLVIGFAAVAVINGIFISETFKAASLDDNVLVLQKDMARKMFSKKMKAFLRMADVSGDGVVDLKEFRAIMKKDQVKTWLSAQGLEAHGNEDLLFMMLDIDSSGHICVEEVVQGISKLQGTARSFDIAKLTNSQHRIFHKMERLQAGLRSLEEGLRAGASLYGPSTLS